MYPPTHPSQPQINHLSVPPSHPYQSQMIHQTSSLLQITYNLPQPSTQPLTKFPQMESGLVVPVFNQGDDPIACLNKAMDFLIAIAYSRGGKDKVMLPKRPRNAAWFKEKAMLAEAQEARQILDEEQLAFLTDPGIPDGQATQTTILNTVSNAKAVLMANLSSYGSDVLSEVPHSKTSHNDMGNQSVHAIQDFEQTPIVDFSDNEITSDSNIIPYSQYLQVTQLETIQDTNFYAHQDSMILFVIEQMSEQMVNCINNWEKANQEKNNESVTVELERYKERVKNF
ncbi:hypothetical protein Tco_0475588 [Tanacetum coccineum]